MIPLKTPSAFSHRSIFRQRLHGKMLVLLLLLACKLNAVSRFPASPHNLLLEHQQLSLLFPVKLLNFYGRPKKDIIAITWATANEKNVNHFELEGSANGNLFNFINKQTGKGVNGSSDIYGAEDFRPVPGINFYRLKIVCNNGDVFYSDTIKVKYQRL